MVIEFFSLLKDFANYMFNAIPKKTCLIPDAIKISSFSDVKAHVVRMIRIITAIVTL